MKTVNFLIIIALLLLNASSFARAEYFNPEEVIKPIVEHFPEEGKAACNPTDPRGC